jgi:hypothetical protein
MIRSTLSIFVALSMIGPVAASETAALIYTTHSKVKKAGTKDGPIGHFIESNGNKVDVRQPMSFSAWNISFAGPPEFIVERIMSPSAVRVNATGDDPLFIDYVVLESGTDHVSRIAQWGIPEGRGWCLSTSSQVPAGWESLVDGCYAELTFVVADQSAYATYFDTAAILAPIAPKVAQYLLGHVLPIQNRWVSKYLVNSSNSSVPSLLPPEPLPPAWQFEDAGSNGLYIRSTMSGKYLRWFNDGTLDMVFPRPDHSPAAKWIVVPIGENFYKICIWSDPRSCLNNQTGELKVGAVEPGWYSAHWMLPIDAVFPLAAAVQDKSTPGKLILP